MATVVLTTVGSYLGPVGAVLGALLGAVIDNYVLIPALIGEDSRRPSIGSLDLNVSDEGTGATFCYGRFNRVGASVVFISRPFLSGGGGTGKRGNPSPITWWADVVYAVCWNNIAKVRRFDFDGDPVYVRDPAHSATLLYFSTLNFIDFLDQAESVQIWIRNGTTWDLAVWYWTIENARTGGIGGAPIAKPALAGFQVGQPVTCSYLNPQGGLVTQPSVTIPPNPPTLLKLNPLTATVVESRIAGTITNGGITVPRSRLVLDLAQYVDYRQDAATIVRTGTNPFLGQATPGPIAVNDYMFSPWSPPMNGHTIQLDQVGQVYFPNALDPTKTYFHLGTGSGAQVDNNYKARVGSLNAPALPAIAIISVGSANLSAKGNRVPQMTAFVDEVNTGTGTTDRTLGEILTAILTEHTTLTQAQLDFDGLVTDPFVKGINFAGTQQIARVIAPLLLHHDVRIEESFGGIHFKSRTGVDQYRVDLDHMDARPLGQPADRVLRWQDDDPRQVPSRVHVRFLDVDKDLQWGDVVENRRTVSVGEISTRQISLEIAMDSAEATSTARRIMRDAIALQRRVRCVLPFWYLTVTETDILILDGASTRAGSRSPATGLGTELYEGQTRYLSVDRVDIGHEGFIEIEAAGLDALPILGPISASAPPGSGYRDDGAVGLPATIPPAFAVVMDLPPLLDEHMGMAGIYLAWCIPSGGPYAGGFRILRDTGNGTAFVDLGDAGEPAQVGRVLGALPPGIEGVIDYTYTMDVEMLCSVLAEGALESTTETDLLRGQNLAAVRATTGWEIVQFLSAVELQHADYPSERRWRLSGLRRGLLGSERHMAGHTDGSDVFVILDRARMRFLPLDLSLVGKSQRYKIAGLGADATAGPSAFVTVSALSSLSLPVAHVTVRRTSGGDVIFTWLRRTRAGHRVLGKQAAALAEVTASYDVVINPSTTNRTINSASADATYTAAMQTTDGTSGAELTVAIYQRDSVRGRGQPATIRVPQTFAQLGTQDGNVLGAQDGSDIVTNIV